MTAAIDSSSLREENTIEVIGYQKSSILFKMYFVLNRRNTVLKQLMT